jgi:hypothetical protein
MSAVTENEEDGSTKLQPNIQRSQRNPTVLKTSLAYGCSYERSLSGMNGGSGKIIGNALRGT